jgi:hypothetical protein
VPGTGPAQCVGPFFAEFLGLAVIDNVFEA